MKTLLGKLFRTRIPRLHPVVGIDGECNIIYGRYDVYQESADDDCVHDVWVGAGLIVNCFAVRKITEEQLMKWMEVRK